MAHPLEKYTLIAPVVVGDEPDAHNVFLVATNQRFCITTHARTKQEAEWFRDELCVALQKIVDDQTSTPQ
jgi:hypothetical protein